jgi:hypothetical protein
MIDPPNDLNELESDGLEGVVAELEDATRVADQALSALSHLKLTES